PGSPLPAPSPYTEQPGGLAERREPASHPVSPVNSGRRVPSQSQPAVSGPPLVVRRPSSLSPRVPLPPLLASSLPVVADPASDQFRAEHSTVTRLLAIVVTDPSFESAAASVLVAELVAFAAHCRLDYAASLVAESASVCPPSVGGECALGTDVLEDSQEDLECLAAAAPHLVSMLLAPEGDPDAPNIPTPRSYAEAITGEYSSQWQTAMDAEMASWKSTGTYVDEVPLPGANIVCGMWIFKVKRPPGSPPVFKARYMARGFSQGEGVDFFQTFSPTPKMTTLWVLLHVAAHRDYELHFLDFSTAFLQGSLHEEIWLCHPPGFTGSFPPGTQWSLRRPVYGLRQAPREWHDTLRTTLAALGFAPSTTDPLLFLRTDTSLPPFYVPVYVDDLVFATADTEALALVKSKLQKRHTCTDLGELRSYLGLQITWDKARRTITLTQSHMVQRVLQRFGFTWSSAQATPLATGHSLSAPPSHSWSNNGSSVTSPSRPTASPAADNSHLQQQQHQQHQYQQQPMYGMPLSSQPVHTTTAAASSTAAAATAVTAASTAAAAVPGSSSQPGQQSNFVSTGPYQYQGAYQPANLQQCVNAAVLSLNQMFPTPMSIDSSSYQRGPNTWYLGSCCGQHMCSSETRFIVNQRRLENPVVVTVANNQRLTAHWMGSIVLDSVEEDFSLHLNEVLLVPRLGFNLMSSAQLMKKGITLLGEPGKFTLKYGDKKLGTAVEQNGVFVLNFVPERTTADSDNILSLGPWEHRDDIDYTDDTVPREGFVPTSSTTAAAVMLTFDDQGLNDVANSREYMAAFAGWGDTTNMPTDDGVWGADAPDETTWGETPAARTTRLLAEAEQRVAEMEVLDSGRLVGVEPVPAASDQESGELVLAPGEYVDVEVRVPPPNLTRYVAPAFDQIRSDGHQLLLSFFANAEYYLRAQGHKATAETWHKRLGHPSQSTLNNTIKAAVLDKNSLLLPNGLELKSVNRPAPYTICPAANLPHEP
ncbi:unnamed protein product, partial [Closterium sp. NIES-54]